MKRTTYTESPKGTIEREVLVIDIKGAIVGRAATVIAHMLQGKDDPMYARHADMGDVVIAVNSAEVRMTGKKDLGKEYVTYTGYPGGRNTETFASLKERHPEEVIRRAVRGMLPKNKLRDRKMARFIVCAGPDYVIPAEFKSLPIRTVTL